jgi:hypothetical protein
VAGTALARVDAAQVTVSSSFAHVDLTAGSCSAAHEDKR